MFQLAETAPTTHKIAPGGAISPTLTSTGLDQVFSWRRCPTCIHAALGSWFPSSGLNNDPLNDGIASSNRLLIKQQAMLR